MGSDGRAEYRAAEGAPAPQPMPTDAGGAGTLPLLVLSDRDGRLMTADYDMLAIGSQTNTCEPTEFHPIYGSICDWQVPLIVALNGAAAAGACPYSGGNLVHHGPETQYAGSPYVDYPIMAFIPAWKDQPAHVIAVRQGPPGYRDMHLKRLFGLLKLQGWQIDPNPTAVGWQWGIYSETSGYEARDLAPPPEDAPEELIAPDGAKLSIPCDPGIRLTDAAR
jgi:hypothetical protein